MKKTQLTIAGMTCELCVEHVTEVLKGVTGVRTAKVNLGATLATVEHQATVEELIAAVEEEGYLVTTSSEPLELQFGVGTDALHS
jgi:copper chaperone CopZ